MTSHADRHTPDNRTPQELAQAILEHDFLPGTDVINSFSIYMHYNPKENADRIAVVKTLEKIGNGETGSQEDKITIMHIMDVFNSMRTELELSKRSAERTANPSRRPKNQEDELDLFLEKALPPQSEHHKKEEQDDAGSYAVALRNLKNIEPLIRKLANKLDIKLIEPERGKQ